MVLVLIFSTMLCCWLQILQSCTLMALVLIFSTCCVVGCRSCSPVQLHGAGVDLQYHVVLYRTAGSCSPVQHNMVLVLIFSTMLCCTGLQDPAVLYNIMVLVLIFSTMLCCTGLQDPAVLYNIMVLKINTSTMKVQDCRICNQQHNMY